MYSGPVIDCDVHHARSTDAELIPYLSRGWREYVTDRGPAGNVPLTVPDGFPNPRMVQAMLVDNPFNRGFGHPVFHPIYAAAEETGRPVAIHGGAGGWANPPSTGGGSVSTYFETHVLWPQAIQTHLVSFIAHGVFEKYPRLRLVLIEAGSAWLPSLLWRFDTEYKGLRREVPWLKRLPSEYFANHVWVTTQPLEISPQKEDVVDLLGSMNLQDRLVYSSDYPHWDADELDYLTARLPSEWHRRVFFGNACRLYDWKEEDLERTGAAARESA